MNSTDLKSLNLLVVEDEPMLRRQLAANLERLGADVTTAGYSVASRSILSLHTRALNLAT